MSALLEEREQSPAPPARKHSPYHNAALVMAIAITMISLFVISYSLALGRPTPHHVPAAVVGSPGSHPRLVAALERATKQGLQLIPYRSAAQAKRAVEQQHVYAVLVLDQQPPRLLVASASGTSVARLLEQTAGRAAIAANTPLWVSDLRRLPSKDPQGLVSFYVTLAATILGFVTMFQLRANASGMSLRGWLGCVVALAVVGGLMLTLVTDPILGALRGPFVELWAALAGQIAVAALFNCTMLTLVGRWAIIPTWGMFVAIGNASSGGAVAPPLLPPFYGFIGRYLPSGATVETIRNAVYFRGAQHLEPILVLGSWLGIALAALLVASRIRGHTPGTT